MKKSAQHQIVHESETQRQYVRVPIPARVTINNREFTVKDLSSGGLGIANIEGEFEKGGTLPLTLTFPFPDFALDMNLDTQIQNYAPDEKLLGARFINLNPAQISTVNTIVRAFISGEVVSTNDILDVTKRNDFVSLRQHKPNAPKASGPLGIGRNIGAFTLITLLGLGALYIIFQNIYASSFVISSNLGVVKTETLPLSAKVMELVQPEPAPYAEVYLLPNQATRLKINDRANLQIMGEDVRFEGVVRKIIFDETQLQNPAHGGQIMIKVIIEPTQPLSLDAIGKPVKTTFDLF